jgi:uncharacterized protein YdhG (YjbR/CyaY superfamily)
MRETSGKSAKQTLWILMEGKPMKSEKVPFDSIDEYIASFPEDVQKIMNRLRGTIKEAVPEAGEKISYNLPTFTLNGSYLVYFAGWKNHIAFYGAPRGNPEFKEALSPYESGAGTLQFPYDKPVPYGLIGKIVKFRAAENRKRADKKKY